MENSEMKKCPFCAEMIKVEAVKCRYCGSNIPVKKTVKNGKPWQRVEEGKKIAGVCTGIAKMFDVPTLLLPLRLFFIITTIFYGFGAILYIAMWLLMEKPAYEVVQPGTVNSAVNAAEQPKTPEAEKQSENNSNTSENTGDSSAS